MQKLVWLNKRKVIMKKSLLRKKVRQRLSSVFKKRRVLLRGGINILPHLFTLGNAFFGFASVVFASRDEWVAAAYCILLGALMDSLDGRVARFVGIASELGVQLDSLADAISFCFAPAFLAYSWHLERIGPFGILAASVFMFAGLLRLARFNLISPQQNIYFLGLPTTIAGCFLTVILLNARHVIQISPVVLIFLLCFLAALMVSSIPFPTFKQRFFRFKTNWYRLVAVGTFAFVAVLRFNLVLLLFLSSYFIGSLLYAFFLRIRRGR